MTEVLVVSQKWDGSFHRRTRAVQLGTDEAGTWLWVPDGSVVDIPNGSFTAVGGLRLLRMGQMWSAYFTPACSQLDRPKQLYVDITTPATRTGDVIEFIDLDLDVEQLDNGEVRILDLNEFLHHAEQQQYPPDLVLLATVTCDHVVAGVRGGEFPFDGSHLAWLPHRSRPS